MDKQDVLRKIGDRAHEMINEILDPANDYIKFNNESGEKHDEELMFEMVRSVNALNAMYSRARMLDDDFKLSDDDNHIDRIDALRKMNEAIVFSNAVLVKACCDYMGDDDEWDSEVAGLNVEACAALNKLHACVYNMLAEHDGVEPLIVKCQKAMNISARWRLI